MSLFKLGKQMLWRSRGDRCRRVRFTPLLSAMEDRTLLSTITVMNNSDSGSGSLRAAIANAASGDTINFDPSLTNQTITLTSGELGITKNLTINDTGAPGLSISGNNHSRVFDIATPVTVEIDNLTITHGLAQGANGRAGLPGGNGLPGQGGAVFNAGNLTLNGDTFLSNEAFGGKGGNGNNIGGNGGAGGKGQGGAVFNAGNLTLGNDTFSSNEALGGKGGNGSSGGNGQGGAIYNGPFFFFNVFGYTLSSNEALGGDGGNGDNNGGNGGNGQGSAIYTAGTSLTFSNLTVTSGLAQGGNGGNGGIGGLAGEGQDNFISTNGSDVVVDSSTTGIYAAAGSIVTDNGFNVFDHNTTQNGQSGK